MLKGQIIKISFDGKFNVEMAGHKKTFNNSDEMDRYLIKVLHNAKDKEKLKLLKQDLRSYLK